MPGEAERFTVRGFRQGDEAQILDLFRRCFHVERSLEHWRWKFQRNPFGREQISVAVAPDGQLIGHFGGFVVPFRDRGEDFLAHQMGDSMTDPSARHLGRGRSSVFGRTMLNFYDLFSTGRIGFDYGFNVGNVQQFFIRFLDGHFVEAVPYRARDVKASPLPPLSRLAKLTRGYEFDLARTVSAEWDELFERVWPRYEFLVRRNAAYVRWRYFESPDPYIVVTVRRWRRLVGWSVFRVREQRLVWGDALFDRDAEEAPELLLRHVVAQFPIDVVEGWFPARPAWFAAALDRLQMPLQPEPQRLGMIAATFTRPDAIERLGSVAYYTMGDGDLF